MNKPFNPPDTHNLARAAHCIGKQGGAKRISDLTGKNSRTVLNELNPKCTDHKLGLVDSVIYQLAVGNFDVLREYASLLGHVATPIEDFTGVSDIELLNSYSDWSAALSAVHAEISKALSDRTITRNEFQDIQSALNKSMAVGLEFLFRVEAVIDENA